MSSVLRSRFQKSISRTESTGGLTKAVYGERWFRNFAGLGRCGTGSTSQTF
jgi:hypothetical protein